MISYQDCQIKDAGSICADDFFPEAEEMINGEVTLTPGFIDCHIHVLEAVWRWIRQSYSGSNYEGLTKFGVTVVGCLERMESVADICIHCCKRQKIEWGNVCILQAVGSYWFLVQFHIDGQCMTKILWWFRKSLEPEKLDSDHHSSADFWEFARVIADTKTGSSSESRCTVSSSSWRQQSEMPDLIERVVDETDNTGFSNTTASSIEIGCFFCKSIEYALERRRLDFTGNEDIDHWETICDE